MLVLKELRHKSNNVPLFKAVSRWKSCNRIQSKLLFRLSRSLWKSMRKCARYSCSLTAVLVISIQSDLNKESPPIFTSNIEQIWVNQLTFVATPLFSLFSGIKREHWEEKGVIRLVLEAEFDEDPWLASKEKWCHKMLFYARWIYFWKKWYTINISLQNYQRLYCLHWLNECYYYSVVFKSVFRTLLTSPRHPPPPPVNFRKLY